MACYLDVFIKKILLNLSLDFFALFVVGYSFIITNTVNKYHWCFISSHLSLHLYLPKCFQTFEMNLKYNDLQELQHGNKLPKYKRKVKHWMSCDNAEMNRLNFTKQKAVHILFFLFFLT